MIYHHCGIAFKTLAQRFTIIAINQLKDSIQEAPEQKLDFLQ
jgi:hypothetical protein